MRRALALIVVLSLALSLLALGGCGKPTARSAANAFVNLMKAGKYEEAAKYWNLDAEGRQKNPDWDTFGKSQRQLIIDKDLAPNMARTLEMWSGYFPGATKVVTCVENGDEAQATLDGGRIGTLRLVKEGEAWKVSDMQ